MADDSSVAELKELQRGRGCEADDLAVRVGPLLRRAFSISEGDPPPVIRSKLVAGLASLSEQLSPDLRLAVRTALALEPASAQRFLKDRMAWLARQFDRDPKTARRRVATGFVRLADVIDEMAERVAENDYVPGGWYVSSATAVLRMDLDPPTLTETRTIVAVVDDLDEIVLSLSVPRGAGSARVVVEAEYGGEIVEEHDGELSHARFVMRLPRPLTLGERHDYSVVFRSVPRAELRPYYVFSPLRRLDHCVVRVRFGRDGRPARLWRLNGLPPRLVDDFRPTDEALELDALGEVRTEFFGLRPGLSYGIQWAPVPAAVAGPDAETGVPAI